MANKVLLFLNYQIQIQISEFSTRNHLLTQEIKKLQIIGNN
jgi:hypothetical protein